MGLPETLIAGFNLPTAWDMSFVVDVHTHPHLLGVRPEDIVEEARRAGLDRCVILGIDIDLEAMEEDHIKKDMDERYREGLGDLLYMPGGALFLPTIYGFYGSEAYMRYIRAMEARGSKLVSNREIADMVSRWPDLLVGFGSVAPTRSEEEVRAGLREARSLGLKGIKLLPTLQWFDPSRSENFALICEFCEREKLVLLIHTGCDPGPFELPSMSSYARPSKLEPVLEVYSPPVILAHMGAYSAYRPGIWLEEALELGMKFDNVWFDTSAVNRFVFGDKSIVERIRETVGFDRVLFGSDYPVVEGATIRSELSFVAGCPYLSDGEREQVLGLNARELLGL